MRREGSGGGEEDPGQFLACTLLGHSPKTQIEVFGALDPGVALHLALTRAG